MRKSVITGVIAGTMLTGAAVCQADGRGLLEFVGVEQVAVLPDGVVIRRALPPIRPPARST